MMHDERGLFNLIAKCLRSADIDIWREGESFKKHQHNKIPVDIWREGEPLKKI